MSSGNGAMPVMSHQFQLIESRLLHQEKLVSRSKITSTSLRVAVISKL